MNKPPDIVLELWEIGNVTKLSVEQRMISEDDSETYVHLESFGQKKAVYKWTRVSEYLTLHVDYSGVARLNGYWSNEASKWKKFEQDNAAELAEFKRLQAKFGK